MKIKILLLLFRKIFYRIFNVNIIIGKNANIHPFAKIVASHESEVKISDNCAIAGAGIINAENGGGVFLHENVSLSRGVQIYARKHVVIGSGTMLGNGTMIFDHDHDYMQPGGVRANKYIEEPISIGKNVWTGCNVVILRGTVLGDNCVVGAGAVIKGKYPDNSIIIQKREENVKVFRLQED